MPPSPISSTAACCMTSASHAAASALPPRRTQTRAWCCATGVLERAATGDGRSRYRARAASDTCRLPLRPRARGQPAAAAAGGARDLAQGARCRHFSRYYSEPQLRVRGTLALAERRARCRRRPCLARSRMERCAARARRGRLGLDRHEPRRWRRADRVSPAPPATARRSGRAAAIGLRAAQVRAFAAVGGHLRRRSALEQSRRRRRPIRSSGP
jgi:hypothetical protein